MRITIALAEDERAILEGLNFYSDDLSACKLSRIDKRSQSSLMREILAESSKRIIVDYTTGELDKKVEEQFSFLSKEDREDIFNGACHILAIDEFDSEQKHCSTKAQWKKSFKSLHRSVLEDANIKEMLQGVFTGSYEQAQVVLDNDILSVCFACLLKAYETKAQAEEQAEEPADTEEKTSLNLPSANFTIALNALGSSLIGILELILAAIAEQNVSKGNKVFSKPNSNVLASHFGDFMTLQYGNLGSNAFSLLFGKDPLCKVKSNASNQLEKDLLKIAKLTLAIFDNIFGKYFSYKSLIDSLWPALYTPKVSWTKFSNIAYSPE